MPLAPGRYRVTVSLEGFQTFVRDAIDRRRPERRRPERDPAGGRRPAGSGRDRVGAAARHGRRPAWADDSQRGLHRPAAGDEHRRTARSDGVHVPDAGRAVGRPLGQRDGRPGLHDRHVRGRHPHHQRRRAGRRPQPELRDLGRSGRSVPGRDERHRRDVQRPGRVQLHREVGHEHVPRERVRVLPEQGARREGVLFEHQAGRQPARVRIHVRRPDPQEPDVLLHGVRRVPRPPADGVRADVRFPRWPSATATSAGCR